MALHQYPCILTDRSQHAVFYISAFCVSSSGTILVSLWHSYYQSLYWVHSDNDGSHSCNKLLLQLCGLSENSLITARVLILLAAETQVASM